MSGVHVRHWPGDPHRPALALHCMMGHSGGWAGVAEALGGRVDLRAFDMPGHGRSPDWDGAVDFHTTVTRIAAAMIDRPVDLIGHSLGATVALRIAVGAPDAIRTLTLIEPVLFAAVGGAATPGLAEAFAADDMAAAARAFLGEWGAQGFDDLPAPAKAAVTRQMRLVADTDAALNRDAARILRDGGLEGIDAPVLLISGADSPPVIHAIAEALATRLPDVGRALVPGAGHMAPITHPAQVAGLIGANLDRA